MKKKKGKIVYVKPVVNHDILQLDIMQEKVEKKPTPDKIFEGYKAEIKSKPKKKKKK
tara:strand:- start:969 stop:1139 length:171 start_codon:yes stop_codon:yes gene_type:complete